MVNLLGFADITLPIEQETARSTCAMSPVERLDPASAMPVVAGIGDPGRAFGTGISDAGYKVLCR